MHIVDARDEANKFRRMKKRQYDGRMALSTPLVLSGMEPRKDTETERLRQKNEAMKRQVASSQTKRKEGISVKTVNSVRTGKHVHYTDGIGE